MIDIVAYHWSTGVEYQRMIYDDSGNLTLLIRGIVGDTSQEIELNYNQNNQVIKKVQTDFCLHSDCETIINKVKSEYNLEGILSAKSSHIEFGVWNTCEFIIK